MGYDERTGGRLARAELPGRSVVIIFELGPALRVGAAQHRHRAGFVAGLATSPTLTNCLVETTTALPAVLPQSDINFYLLSVLESRG